MISIGFRTGLSHTVELPLNSNLVIAKELRDLYEQMGDRVVCLAVSLVCYRKRYTDRVITGGDRGLLCQCRWFVIGNAIQIALLPAAIEDCSGRVAVCYWKRCISSAKR